MQQTRNIELKKIGRTDLKVAPLAFGGNVFGWTADEKTSFALLDRFVEEGFNLIDTADVYSRWAGKGGESETIIGKWLQARKCREKVVIATKVGMDMGEGAGLKKKYILKAAQQSLRRLRTDYIDLYQSHRDDLSTPVDETLEAYAVLTEQKKVRYIGASNFTAQRLREALAASAKSGLPRYECLQPHYNLCEREGFENELALLCLSESISVIPYYSLAAGFLTGKYRSENDIAISVRGKGASRYLNERGKKILAALDVVASECQSKPAAVAIAWLLSRPAVTAPIASATDTRQLADLFTGARLQLSREQIMLLDQASDWQNP